MSTLGLEVIEQQWASHSAVDDIKKAGSILVKDYGRKFPVGLIVADDISEPI